MNNTLLAAKHALLALTLTIAPSLQAAVEQWAIFEAFTNAEGDVQFVELLSPTDVQSDLPSVALSSFDSDGNLIASVLLANDSLLESTNTNVLFATQSFVDNTGLEADQIIPDGFLPTRGGRVEFADGIAFLNLVVGQVPLNGEQSIGFGEIIAFASPTNSERLSATVAEPVNARFDAESGILNLPIVDAGTLGVANVSLQVDLGTSQFTVLEDSYIYAERVQAPSSAAALSTENVLRIPRLEFNGEVYDFEISILQDEPLVFGNINVLSVSDL